MKQKPLIKVETYSSKLTRVSVTQRDGWMLTRRQQRSPLVGFGDFAFSVLARTSTFFLQEVSLTLTLTRMDEWGPPSSGHADGQVRRPPVATCMRGSRAGLCLATL